MAQRRPAPAKVAAGEAAIIYVSSADGARWYVKEDPATFDAAVTDGKIVPAMPGGMNSSRFADNAKWKLNCAQVVAWMVD